MYYSHQHCLVCLNGESQLWALIWSTDHDFLTITSCNQTWRWPIPHSLMIHPVQSQSYPLSIPEPMGFSINNWYPIASIDILESHSRLIWDILGYKITPIYPMNIPSGKLTWLWKTTLFIGESTINGPFSIANPLAYQRVPCNSHRGVGFGIPYKSSFTC